ncbi:MAG: hypothetical protein E6H01_01475 [Bacillati bacterium ANGP1]|uniref:Peptidase S8/S53 domain-containing protein n=1 Tax=Candidatus Segetimicrobium genomatis TaxID=2569760 RepID=A0A537LER6_9BACT|nr:MAG: hypothetical protein E6H01_01475 [Terrabacteria group bacterium ANGP1]
MRAVIVGCVSFLVGLLVSGVFPHAAPAQTAGTQGRFVVVFAGSQIPPGAGRLIEAAGGRVAQVFPEVGIAVAVSDSAAFPNTLSRSGLVQAVGEDRVRQLPDASATEVESDGGLTEPAATTCPPTCPAPGVDDLYFLRQWHLRRIRADAAWTVTTGSSDIVVAVIDNGVASNHPDLGHLVFNSCFWTRPDACRPYPSIPFTQGGSHGTEVAGIIGATFSGGRVVGVGPNLSLANYNVFEIDSATGQPVAFESSIWAAMRDATLNPLVNARVINLSVGELIVFPQKEAALWTAWNRVAEFVTRHGVTIVASSGNEGMSLNGPVAHVPSDLPSVIGVGATGIRPGPLFPQEGAFDVKAYYANFGAALTLVAPGGDCGPANPRCIAPILASQVPFFVQSTGVMPAAACAATASCLIGYVRDIGTSFAAPHVAGVAGLILSQNPGLNPHQVAAILKRTAQPLGDRQEFGHGMVDAAAAVDAATAVSTP